MKLISLNLWGGRVHAELTVFLKEYSQTTDIFCFQEMYHQADGKFSNAKWADDGINPQLFDYIKSLLPGHNGIFYPHFEDFWGLAIFVKKDIPILEEGEQFVHHASSKEEEQTGATSKNLQYISIEFNHKKVNIVNFHGLYGGRGFGKGDSESRIKQSKNIVIFLESLSGEIVLCGDFNLKPNTESLKMIENAGLINLIKEAGVTSTRTSFYKKDEKFADYTLVTDGISVKKFKVLPDEISDHNAMLLEFDI